MTYCNIKTPTPETLLKCASREELEAALAAARTNCKGSAVFLPPPFLPDAVLYADTTEPLKLILISIAEAKEFDRIHEDDDDYTDSAMTHVKEFAQWAWGVEAGLVLETSACCVPKMVNYTPIQQLVSNSASCHH